MHKCDKSSLRRHLIQWHPDIISFIQKEITRTWLSQHFTFDMENNTNCVHCDYSSKIYNGPNILKNHLNKSLNNIKIESEFDGTIEDYNVDTTTQQSIAEENATISFHHYNASHRKSTVVNVTNIIYNIVFYNKFD